MKSPEEIIKEFIPNGIVNIKGKGDGKPQYKAEIDIIKRCMTEYAQLQIEGLKKDTDLWFQREILLTKQIESLREEITILSTENFHLSAEITAVSEGYNRVELQEEVKRLRGLIEKAFIESYTNTYHKKTVDAKWEQFKIENRL